MTFLLVDEEDEDISTLFYTYKDSTWGRWFLIISFSLSATNNMKILGWVLLVVGLIGLWYSYSADYGLTGYIISVIVGVVGLWLAMRKEGGGTMV